MTITEAIRLARQDVKLVHYGRNDATVLEYVPAYRAWTESQHMDVFRARAARREVRIRYALEALGKEGAAALANVNAGETGRWDDIVRQIHRGEAR